MKTELKQIETIERYLLGELSPEEKALVEAKMAESPSFRESVERQALVVDRLQSMGLRTAILEGQARYEGKGKKKWKNLGKWGLGLVLLLAVLGSVWLGMPGSEQEQYVLTDTHVAESSSDAREEIPVQWKLPFAEFEVDAIKGGKIQSPQSRTIVRIPANALVDADGQAVTGKVTVHYREFRDAVDIAFSGIPMTYAADGDSFQFNSAGMFEIRATQGEQPVYLKEDQSLAIDFDLTERLEGLSFYALADSSQRWTKLKDINLSEPERHSTERDDVTVSDSGRTEGDFILAMDAPIDFGENGMDSIAVFQPSRESFDDSDDRQTGTLLAASDRDPTHHYPRIVRALQSPSFGVYNCDQIFRLPNTLQIQARYLDQRGIEFNSFFHLSMINLNYNSSFSFDPGYFTFSTEGETALLLFLKGGALYGVHPDDFAALDIKESGSYSFQPEEIFRKIKTTAALKQWLGIEGGQ